ncbi:MAG: hypothetical protein ACYCX3_11660 [Thermoleophilia bacterium]
MSNAFIVLALLILLIRTNALSTSARVSEADFRSCLDQLDRPAVHELQRRVTWLIGDARYRYICEYRGLQLQTTSFKPLVFVDDVALIRTVKW